ncbi:ABC transporter transmembrane domain-containing protein [Atopobium sp. oral taxon 416]|uniref:ABC transporter transmembrane domain-containing protein n=1 Tax=Atopobium sp. oral taxon 416 TaxID=712157 RepID=UPI002013399B|nr:ABC transporter transmembrane domain-containing protein [Atopobium sp. oral taxon 416]
MIVYAVSQALSKLQDYSVYRLEINGNYKLARLCFDTLSNRSMKFHTSRFGRSLMSECTQLVDVVVYSLIPIVASVVATFVILGPAVSIYAVLLAIMLVIYLIVTTKMYRRILPLSTASRAQNTLSGVLSGSVTNILAVKTYGREDFERELFNKADVRAKNAETRNMRAPIQHGFAISVIITIASLICIAVLTSYPASWSSLQRSRPSPNSCVNSRTPHISYFAFMSPH